MLIALATGHLVGCFLAHSPSDAEEEASPPPRPVPAPAPPAPDPPAPDPGHDICPSAPADEEACPCGVAERRSHPDPTDGSCFVCHACPEGCDQRHPDDGPMFSGSGARLSWQAPGGFAGWGPAVIVTEDGTGAGMLRAWDQVVEFDPAGEPSVAPDHTARLDFVALDQLFLRLRAADTEALPHEGAPADCYPVFFAQECPTCPAIELRYHTHEQMLPELACVADWLASQLPAGVRSPATSCSR